MSRRGAARPGEPGLRPAPVVGERAEQAEVRECAGEQPDRRDREQRLRLGPRSFVPVENGAQSDVHVRLEASGAGVARVHTSDGVPQLRQASGVESTGVDEVAVFVGERNRFGGAEHRLVLLWEDERLAVHEFRTQVRRLLDLRPIERLVAEPERGCRILHGEQAGDFDRQRLLVVNGNA